MDVFIDRRFWFHLIKKKKKMCIYIVANCSFISNIYSKLILDKIKQYKNRQNDNKRYKIYFFEYYGVLLILRVEQYHVVRTLKENASLRGAVDRFVRFT